MNSEGIAKMVRNLSQQPHGTYLRYNAGCRCDACRVGKNDYARERAVAQALGLRNRIVDATASREHLIALREGKVSSKAIALASGLPLVRIVAVRSGKQSNVREATERAILAVTSQDAAFNGRVPAARSRTLLERVKRGGMSMADINRKLGRHPKAHLITRENVSAQTARAIWLLYYEVIIMAGAASERERRQGIRIKAEATYLRHQLAL